jgi:uncharacterized protein YbjT (DUF2867 family)
MENQHPIQRTALVAGASGLVGGHCIELLLHDGSYSRVVALVRRPLGIKHEKLSEVVVDFEQLDGRRDEMRATDVFCCLGTTIKQAGSKEAFNRVDHDYPVSVAKAALENGAKQFLLVTSIGADPKSSVFYSRTKGKVEEDISLLNFEGTQIFRPSMLLGERKEPRTGERIAAGISKLMPFIFAGPLHRYRPIEARTVAAAMIKVAKEGRQGVNVFESEEIQRIGSESKS